MNRNAIRIVGAALLAGLGLVAVAPETAAQPAPGKTVTVDDTDNMRTVALNVGDTLVVKLASNPTTGYVWHVSANNDQLLQQVGQSKFERASTDLIGAPGAQTFTFKAVGPGADSLALVYQRPGARSLQGAHGFQILANVRDATTKGGATANRTIVLGAAQNNATVPVNVGDNVVVHLPANPSTGYSWSITEGNDAILKPVSSRFQRGASRPGAPGEQRFTFKVVGGGALSLKLSYARPFDKDAPPAQTWQAFITVPVSYACAENKSFVAGYGVSKVVVNFDGETEVLTQEESGSGVRYASATWVLLGKGNEATLLDASTNEPLAVDCETAPAAAAAPATPAPVAPTPLPPVNYACPDGQTFTVVFSGASATLTFAGQTYALTQQPAADGINYANDKIQLRGKGNVASLLNPSTGAPIVKDCVATQTAQAAASAVTPMAPHQVPTALFACPNGQSFAIRFDGEEAMLRYDGMLYALTQQPSGSGIRYSNDDIEFRNKGKEASLYDANGKPIVVGCMQQ